MKKKVISGLIGFVIGVLLFQILDSKDIIALNIKDISPFAITNDICGKVYKKEFVGHGDSLIYLKHNDSLSRYSQSANIINHDIIDSARVGDFLLSRKGERILLLFQDNFLYIYAKSSESGFTYQ